LRGDHNREWGWSASLLSTEDSNYYPSFYQATLSKEESKNLRALFKQPDNDIVRVKLSVTENHFIVGSTQYRSAAWEVVTMKDGDNTGSWHDYNQMFRVVLKGIMIYFIYV
jgi:hypothetical protein